MNNLARVPFFLKKEMFSLLPLFKFSNIKGCALSPVLRVQPAHLPMALQFVTAGNVRYDNGLLFRLTAFLLLSGFIWDYIVSQIGET